MVIIIIIKVIIIIEINIITIITKINDLNYFSRSIKEMVIRKVVKVNFNLGFKNKVLKQGNVKLVIQEGHFIKLEDFRIIGREVLLA